MFVTKLAVLLGGVIVTALALLEMITILEHRAHGVMRESSLASARAR